MPFGGNCEYANFESCISANQDKSDPEAYCAVLMRETEDGCASRSVRMLKTKVYRPERMKVLDEANGLVTATVSSESQDRDGDVIRAAGWSLDNFHAHPVLLASHDYSSLRSQIGIWESMRIEGTEMKGVARFFIGKGNEEADWAFELAKENALAFSVGFIPDMEKAAPLNAKDAYGMRGMEFNGQELLEVSAVTVPSNPDALQRFVKSPNLHPVMKEIADDVLDIAATHVHEPVKAPEIDVDALVALVIERMAERTGVIEEEAPATEADSSDEDSDDDSSNDTENSVEQENVVEFDPYSAALAAAEAALQEVEEE